MSQWTGMVIAPVRVRPPPSPPRRCAGGRTTPRLVSGGQETSPLEGSSTLQAATLPSQSSTPSTLKKLARWNCEVCAKPLRTFVPEDVRKIISKCPRCLHENIVTRFDPATAPNSDAGARPPLTGSYGPPFMQSVPHARRYVPPSMQSMPLPHGWYGNRHEMRRVKLRRVGALTGCVAWLPESFEELLKRVPPRN